MFARGARLSVREEQQRRLFRRGQRERGRGHARELRLRTPQEPSGAVPHQRTAEQAQQGQE